MAKKMIQGMWQLHEMIDDKNKELSKWQRKLKSKTDELEGVYKKDKDTGQPVSYTHLDVYKRQLFRRRRTGKKRATFFAISAREVKLDSSTRAPGNFSSETRAATAPPRDLPKTCLLYTSRCV